MKNNEKNEKQESLLYYVTKENVNKLIQAVKMKPGNEEDIKTSFGKGKYLQAKKALITLKILDDTMQFTDIGRDIAYDSPNVQELWFETIMKYKPYESYINSYIINHKDTNDDVDTTDIQNFWGRSGFGNSEQNRKDATSTFAAFLELAGIGEFTIGRRGNSSRILINYTKLDESIKKFNNSNNIIQKDTTEKTMEEINKTVDLNLSNQSSITNITDDNISSNINNHNNFSNATININIDMSTWSEDNVIKALEIIKGI